MLQMLSQMNSLSDQGSVNSMILRNYCSLSTMGMKVLAAHERPIYAPRLLTRKKNNNSGELGKRNIEENEDKILIQT
ncbi:hypothetical protein T11_4529 [Trichinella zimbabwensis]|uniref:Uncharacterized protein n=1 Tax=Trichinella zimbabwensis TaxID=268475 RepID=A0A0V1GKY4_9BILA|nr:hypothetical protein T11_4529 [Trichinella zimbabwensis]